MTRPISYRRGDLVQLNSGGPRMLVEEVENEAGTIIKCRWYEGKQRRVERFFTDGIHHFQMTAAAE